MKLKDLTEEQIEKARKIYFDKNIAWDERMKLLMNLFGKTERTTRRWCSGKLGFSEKPEVVPEVLTLAKSKEHNKNKKRFLVTSAQNATKVNKKFFNNFSILNPVLSLTNTIKLRKVFLKHSTLACSTLNINGNGYFLTQLCQTSEQIEAGI